MRRPISRVRSVTDTSMMFMMPMPPTISETTAMARVNIVIVWVMPVRMLVMSSCVRTMKSLSSPGISSCSTRSTASICSETG